MHLTSKKTIHKIYKVYMIYILQSIGLAIDSLYVKDIKLVFFEGWILLRPIFSLDGILQHFARQNGAREGPHASFWLPETPWAGLLPFPGKPHGPELSTLRALSLTPLLYIIPILLLNGQPINLRIAKILLFITKSSYSQSLEQVISQAETHGMSSKKSQEMMDLGSPVVECRVNTEVVHCSSQFF
uniref:Uncharacterized protein n=2 Tax=Micrurus corallinus TaxID=54390 RepID=A0A2D4FIX9_MICCO